MYGHIYMAQNMQTDLYYTWWPFDQQSFLEPQD